MNVTDIEIVDRGERQSALRALVHAPARELFELIANPHRHHEFDGSGSVRPDVIGPRRLEVGDKFTTGLRMGPVKYKMTCTATDVVEDRVVAWLHPGGHTWRYELEAVDANATVVTETFDWREAKVARVFEWAKVPERNERGIRSTLRTLQGLYPV